jgi:hypothetical protein
MDGELDGLRRKIDELARAIADGNIGTSRPWGGAGVAIAYEPLRRMPDDFYPDPRVVVTPYVPELSWLFEQLWAGFRPVLDHVMKLEFFGRLANAATAYHKQAGDNGDIQGLLDAVFVKATSIATEISDGTFVVLHVAPGRAIAEDFTAASEELGH